MMAWSGRSGVAADGAVTSQPNRHVIDAVVNVPGFCYLAASSCMSGALDVR
jgi:hypothetical protein